MHLDNTSAIVTGGVSGLGEAVSRALIGRGARVVALDLNAERGAALAEELGENLIFAQVDVCDEAAVQAAVEQAVAIGPLRSCVNCAGIGMPAARTVGRGPTPYPLERFRKAVEVNLIGTFNVTRLAATAMARTPPLDENGSRGAIVNTASLAAFDGQTGQVAYAAAKAGVAGMTLPLARDLSAVGVRVCTIAPGMFETPIYEAKEYSAEQIAEFKARLIADNVHPMRMGRPDEYAATALHILENDFLNGETIRLDAAARLRANPNR